MSVSEQFSKQWKSRKLVFVFEYEFRPGSEVPQAAGTSTWFSARMWLANTQYVRFKKFRSGDFNLENEAPGRPVCNVDNDELKAAMEGDTYQTMRELAARFKVSSPTILDHLKQSAK